MSRAGTDDDPWLSSRLSPPLSEPHRKENPKMLKRIAFAASLLGALTLAGVAFAGNGAGSNKSSSSISSPIVVSSSSLNALTTNGPRYGDTITFDVSTGATSRPFVHLQCYQNQILLAPGWAM